MTDTTIAILQQVEKTRQLIQRACAKIFKAPAAGPMLKLDCQGQAASDLIRHQLEKACALFDLPYRSSRAGCQSLRYLEYASAGGSFGQSLLATFSRAADLSGGMIEIRDLYAHQRRFYPDYRRKPGPLCRPNVTRISRKSISWVLGCQAKPGLRPFIPDKRRLFA